MLLLSWELILKNDADRIVKALIWEYYKKRNLDNLVRKIYVNRRENPKTIYIEAKNAGMINSGQKYNENKAQLIGANGIHAKRITNLFFQKWRVAIV